jgi:hypothetical protein
VELSPFIDGCMLVLIVDALGLSATRSNSFLQQARQRPTTARPSENKQYCDPMFLSACPSGLISSAI